MGYSGKRLSENNKKRNEYIYEDNKVKKNKGEANHKPGIVLSILLFLLAAFFCFLVIRLKMLPPLYLGVIIAIIAFLFIIAAVLMWNTKKRARFVIGVILAVIIAAVLIYAIIALWKGIGFLNSMTSKTTETSEMAVYVNVDDPAQALDEMGDYTFGLLAEQDRENSDEAVIQLSDELEKIVTTKDYASLTELIDGLYLYDCNAIILNTAYIDVLKEMNGYSDILSRIREVSVFHIEREVEVVNPIWDFGKNIMSGDLPEVVTVYISGIDSRSGMIEKSRSDVNIVATINTKTKEILLVSTPRDFYVETPVSGGSKDKLTNAGIYGVNCSLETLEMLYDIDIDYYFRVNFSGFEDIVDSLGGITVYSEYSFNSFEDTELGHPSYYYEQGYNNLNGAQALSFARERHAFSAGDRQRGKNQMEVIKAVISKATSSEILYRFYDFFSALEGNFETSMPYDLIAALVQNQLDKGGEWNISSYSVTGWDDSRVPYSQGGEAYVMQPDWDTVDTAESLMEQVRSGQKVVLPEEE